MNLIYLNILVIFISTFLYWSANPMTLAPILEIILIFHVVQSKWDRFLIRNTSLPPSGSLKFEQNIHIHVLY